MGSLGMIIPLSVTSGQNFEKVRRIIYGHFGKIKATHYSIRPAKIFPEVDQRTSIIVCTNAGHSPCKVYSSKLYRFRDGEQEDVVLKAKVGDAGIMEKGYIPRVGDEIGSMIYKKILLIDTYIKDYCVDSADIQGISKWYFHSVGRYWLKAYLNPPYFARDGKMGISSNIVIMNAISPDMAKSAVGIVNSSLFYYWWMLQSDEFHLLRRQVENFVFPSSLISDKEFHKSVDTLVNDFSQKAIRKRIQKGGQVIEMDEVHARLSRDAIRKVDRCLASHYELVEQELEYLDKYDEQFRASED